MKVVEKFTLVDSYESDKETIQEAAMDAAKRRQEYFGDFTIEDLKVELVEDGAERKYQVEVFGTQVEKENEE